MDLIKTINTRRSVRRYKESPVSKETIENLIQAAVMAPTAMNAQPWAFGVIQDSELMQTYSDQIKVGLLENLHQFPIMERYRDMLSDPEYHVFYKAPALVVIYARPDRSPAPQIDCAMAAQNLMLAARSMGLGTCWIGFAAVLLNQPEVKKDLGVPEDYQVVAPIIIGYPDGDIPVPEKEAPEIAYWK